MFLQQAGSHLSCNAGCAAHAHTTQLQPIVILAPSPTSHASHIHSVAIPIKSSSSNYSSTTYYALYIGSFSRITCVTHAISCHTNQMTAQTTKYALCIACTVYRLCWNERNPNPPIACGALCYATLIVPSTCVCNCHVAVKPE